jgi:alkylated DNA repair dioxygenase AlkB
MAVGVSLLAPATMRFRREDEGNWLRISHTLEPRSIYILSGEARTEWEHSIPPLDALRYSITFRTFLGYVLFSKGTIITETLFKNSFAYRPEDT